MIPSRQQADVVKILEQFKKVETITRDFSKSYKAAINEALPHAKQIVDRFHILKNLTDNISNYLKRILEDKIKIADSSTIHITEKGILNAREHDKIATGLRKWKVIKDVQNLKRLGKNNTQIAKILKLSRATVIKYLNITEPPIDSRACILDTYIPRIKQLLLDGYKHSEIFQRIKDEGYTGQISLFNSKMKGISWEIRHNIRYLKRSDIKKLLFTSIDKIKDELKRNDIIRYLKSRPELEQILKLVSEFKIILLGKRETELDRWIEQAEQIQVKEMDRFLKLIRSDMEAVKNAITYRYSNGLTEGHNNKIKMIKRQMYGRCKFDLLRLKILH